MKRAPSDFPIPLETPEIGNDKYPAWICRECAEARGHRNRCTLSTYHEGVCGWCENVTTVTQPRDYGYPKFSK